MTTRRTHTAQLARLAVLVACGGAVSAATAQADYSFEQVTEFGFGTSVFEVSIAQASADRIAFRTTGSLDGPNDGGNFEVFLYDIPSATFTQVTDTPFGIGNFTPLLTPDGGTIVFRSLFDFVGDGQGGQFELYEYDVAAQTFSRLVNIAAGQVREDYRMSGDGRYVVFVTAADLTGGNPDGNFEVFRVDRTDGSVVQVTDSTSGLRSFPDISGDGRFVVYAQNNPNNVMLWDALDGSTTNLTNQSGTNSRVDAPQISDDGRFVSFYSLRGFDPNQPSLNGLQVIDRDAGTITRVARPAIDNDDNDPFTMEMAPDGSAVFFESDQQLGTLRDLYRYDIAADTIERITTGTPLISDAALSTDASRRYVSVAFDGTLAYRSEQPELDPGADNSTGTNLDLFVATAPAEPCPGDATGDGLVNADDLLVVLGAFGTAVAGGVADGDFDDSGTVNADDLLVVLGAFGTACP